MRKKWALALAVCSTLIASFACEQTVVEINSPEQVKAVIESERKRLAMPGYACLAVKKDAVVFAQTGGYANIAAKKPFTMQTRMLIASVSKTMAVTAVMQLYEQGRIVLDADINQYLPFRVRNPQHPDTPITVRMLLTHTSSISDAGYASANFYLFGYVDHPQPLIQFERNYLTPQGSYYTKNSFSAHQPGTKHQYTNVGTALLACLVEHITGQDYNTYCKENIFKPLGMQRTTWFFSETPKDQVAVPYTDARFTAHLHHFFTYPTYPDGHLITTPEDLSVFMRALLMGGEYNGKRLLKTATLDTIFTHNVSLNMGNQGLIFFNKKPLGNLSLWGHDGGDPGVSTEMFFDRQKQIGYIVFVNRTNAYSPPIGQALLLYAHQQ